MVAGAGGEVRGKATPTDGSASRGRQQRSQPVTARIAEVEGEPVRLRGSNRPEQGYLSHWGEAEPHYHRRRRGPGTAGITAATWRRPGGAQGLWV
jgi:hypothetical protein